MTSVPLTPRRSARISPVPAPRQTRPAARARRADVGWASASARNPAISAAVYGALARSRASGASAGHRWAGTDQRDARRAGLCWNVALVLADHDAVLGAAWMAIGVIDVRDDLQVTG